MSKFVDGKSIIEEKSTILFENDEYDGIGILLDGKIDLYMSKDNVFNDKSQILKNSFNITSMSKNSFLGVIEIFENTKHGFSLVAEKNTSIFKISAEDKEKVHSFLMSKNNYSIFLLQSLSETITNLTKVKNQMLDIINQLQIKRDNLSLVFWKLKSLEPTGRVPQNEVFIEAKNIYEKNQDKIPNKFYEEFIQKPSSSIFGKTYSNNIEPQEDGPTLFFKEFSSIPLVKKKDFILCNTKMSMPLASIGSSIVLALTNNIKETINELLETIDLFTGSQKESIFSLFNSCALDLKKEKKSNTNFLEAASFIFDDIVKLSEELNEQFEYNLDSQIEDMQYLLNEAKGISTSNLESINESDVDVISGYENIPEPLRNSLEKIIRYSDIEKDDADLIRSALEEFRKSTDKFSTEDDMRKIRRSITTVFFKMYKNIMLKSVTTDNMDNLYKMFLNYGYTDERLLDNDQTIMLYKLIDNSKSEMDIYSMEDWAKVIYSQEKEPSFNDFGQFYKESLRELKKRGSITEAQMEEYLASSEKRLEYEVDNMITTTNRLCYGQISVYVPTLHKDMITTNLQNCFITKERLEKTLNTILDLDFSLFHREVLYKNAEANIERELIMAQVIPLFVLTPTFGNRSTMWQELEGSNKSSQGRIILPIFTNEDLEDMLLKAVGGFRWELCKNMLGPMWNDISEGSLTAYYNDYVQFYKKNREMTDEAKERLKVQIQKHRGNLKDFFVSDYILWMKYESKGILRLNKIARNILFRFVPFSKEVRDELEKLPMFADYANKFRNIRRKRATEIKNRFHRYSKNGEELPQALADHLSFFRDK